MKYSVINNRQGNKHLYCGIHATSNLPTTCTQCHRVCSSLHCISKNSPSPCPSPLALRQSLVRVHCPKLCHSSKSCSFSPLSMPSPGHTACPSQTLPLILTLDPAPLPHLLRLRLCSSYKVYKVRKIFSQCAVEASQCHCMYLSIANLGYKARAKGCVGLG